MNPVISCDDGLQDDPIMGVIRDALQGPAPFVFAENRPLFEKIFASDLTLRALKSALGRTREDSEYQLPRFVMEGLIRGWTILTTPYFSVSIGVRRGGSRADAETAAGTSTRRELATEPNQPRLQPYPFDLFIGFLHVEDLDMDCYRVLPPETEDSFHTLEFDRNRGIGAGDTLLLRAGNDVTIATLHGVLVYMEITGLPVEPVLPQFDPATREFCGWISGDPVASRLELLTRTLADFAYQDAREQLLDLSRHRDHYVRWNSMRHLLRIDGEACIPRLNEALDDEHPAVREAASQTLAWIAELAATETTELT